MPDNPVHSKGQSALREAALFGLCPRCGARSLFAGWIAFAQRCSVCGLEFARFNVGDGAVAFVTMVVGGVVMILVIVVQLAADPPWWVHVLLWIPVTTFGVIGALRVAKAALLWSEFRQETGESGRQ